ncbi:MAG: carboxypeptidase regulatory-like domain-containing protein [Gemmatimonadota bacterium]|nr:carboxypeptidase regulatory-like domain-containing protein [Gemmatimonadota bacterium]
MTAALLLAVAAPAAAQRTTTFVAAVADAATGAPVRDAQVLLTDLYRVARTNWMGEATFSDVPAGKHVVRVRKPGFVPAELTLMFRGDTVGQVFMLGEIPHTLDTIRVTAQATPPYLQPFENRRRIGIGRFLTANDLANEGLKDFRLIAETRFPGLRVQRDSSGREMLLNAVPRDGGNPCPVVVYLDGQQIDQGDVWNLVQTWDLAGVEFYDGTDTPSQYRVSGSMCGVVLLWSK